jgi:HD-GYP domain-containing protein (c-di-GMP phosphodiesterase class II)
MAVIKRINLQQLKVGMYVTQVDADLAAAMNVRAEGLITRQDTIELFRQHGMTECYIDTRIGEGGAQGDTQEVMDAGQSLRASPSNDGATAIDTLPDDASTQELARQPLRLPFCDENFPRPQLTFDAERSNALAVRNQALTVVSDVIRDVKMGAKINLRAIDTAIVDITESLINNQNVILSMATMRKKDEYLLEHSMNVAVLMGVLARSLGYRGEELHELVLGAFVHDVGKIRVPDSILHNPGKLNAEEWEEMKRHVDYGVEILSGMPRFSPLSMKVCAEHHEHLDGRGYPFGLSASEISPAGRMGAVVDVYDAITSDRVYHKGLEPNTALKKMLEWSGDHLDRDLVYQLIRCVGVYPAGSMVRLSSGYLAVVMEVSPVFPEKPRVKLIYDNNHQRVVTERIVDLALTDRYGVIKSAAAPSHFGLNVRDYL